MKDDTSYSAKSSLKRASRLPTWTNDYVMSG
ncbi:uncharacterized protein G2W53_016018 [Senna tora]|uniref:Uncharacterized protein n=1 Tax=Senna tora TaxID=362788 RepID=A0A835C8N7_9FABA|nr:uncharacterized protein G2W53_016018 [Senna tora]